MGWVEKQFQDQHASEKQQDTEATAAENSFQQKAQEKWAALLSGFKEDVEEFRRITGRAEFEERNPSECRVSNPQARIAVLVTVDLPQHAIRYSYEPEGSEIAVPEQGVLTLRVSGPCLELYSADQLVTSEQARRLVLEPLLFPNQPKSSAF